MKKDNLKIFLDAQVKRYQVKGFIQNDPICIPHMFTTKQDIEIMGFFAAIFAWGQRVTIINKSKELIERFHGRPYDFILNHQESDLKILLGFKHRTFNDTDLLYFVAFLNMHYRNTDSLETAFSMFLPPHAPDIEPALNGFRDYFFSLPHVPDRSRKHIASPKQNSACKRINMFLRWMVRQDVKGVDFGIWKSIKASQLVCPLDVHVARVARKLGLLNRTQNDWQAALELTQNLKKFNPKDPVKYDFALFGLGVEGEI